MRHEASTEDGSALPALVVVFDQAEIGRIGESCAFHEIDYIPDPSEPLDPLPIREFLGQQGFESAGGTEGAGSSISRGKMHHGWYPRARDDSAAG